MNLRFESGTTREEVAQILKGALQSSVSEAKLNQKFSDEEIAKFLDGVEMHRICDGCGDEMGNEESNFTCRCCSLKFDLCQYCNCDFSSIHCPPNFGCSVEHAKAREVEKPSEDQGEMSEGADGASKTPENIDDAEKPADIFIPKPNRSFETYEMFGRRIVATDADSCGEKNMSEFLDFGDCVYLSRGITFDPQSQEEKKEIPHKFLEDLWLHFRSTSINCIQKYRWPTRTLPRLHTPEIESVYSGLVKLFEEFISYENTRFMLFIYENGDMFVIKRVFEEIPFQLAFIPHSLLNTNLFDLQPSSVSTVLSVKIGILKE